MPAEEGADQPPQQEQQPQQQESQKSGGGGDGGLSMVGKILAFVSIGVLLLGYIICNGSYASRETAVYYTGGFFSARNTLLLFVGPVLLLYLALVGDGGEVIKAVCAFCSSALALWSFFLFVFYARIKEPLSYQRGCTAGLFFTFIGEVVCAVAVFVFA